MTPWPIYAYKGVDPRGKAVTGTKESDSPKTLRAVMRRDGVVVTDVAEARGGVQARPRARKAILKPNLLRRDVNIGFIGGIKKVEVAAFTRQMSTLLKAGIPLSEALGALFDQIENPRLKSIIGEVRSKVNEGSSLADALSKHPKVFEGVFISMVRAGETAGNMDAVLARLADFMEAQVKLRSKVTGAMVYPAIMALVAGGVMTVLMVAVVPKITAIYADTDKTLPWNTQFLIWMSNMLGNNWPFMLVGLPLLFFGFRRWMKSASGTAISDRIVLKLPVIGPLARQIGVGRFARTFGTMLASGVPLLKALDVSKEILGNTVLVKVIETAREQIQQGEPIAGALKKSGQFPSIVTHMIAVGERAGQLEQMLYNVADSFDSDTEMKLARMTSLLEPLMIVGMGGAVAFIVFSILMPIMDMNPT